MRTLVVGLGAALLLGAVFAGTAAAAPSENNPNLEEITLNCEGIGEVTVISVEASRPAFLPDGRVGVGMRFEGEFEFTITAADGTLLASGTDSYQEGVPGKGFEDRLVPCTFHEETTETFILDADTAAAFDIDESYVGTEVTLHGVGITDTAWVMFPGQP